MSIGWEDEPKVVKIPDSSLRQSPKSPEVVGKGNTTVGKISDYNWEDWFRNYISSPVRGFVRQGTELIGGALGGVPGAIAGGTVGDQSFQQTIGRMAPRLWGEPSPNVLDSIKTSALESATDLAFIKGIPALKGLLKTRTLTKFAAPNPNIPIREALQNLPEDFNPSMAQATQNKLVKWVESVVIPESKRDLRTQEQQAVLRGVKNDLSTNLTGYGAENLPTTERIGQLARTSAAEHYKQIKSINDRFYQTADDLIQESKVMGFEIVPPKPSNLIDPRTGQSFPIGKPELKPTSINGPVFPTNTISFSKTVLKDIDDYLADPQNANYETDATRSALQAIKDKVSNYAEGTYLGYRTLPNGTKTLEPVMTYATAKLDKDSYNNALQSISPNAKSRLFGTIEGLRNTLAQDIKESSVGWTPQAQSALKRANEFYMQSLRKNFGPTIAKKLAGIKEYNGDLDILTENILQTGYKNATIASEIVGASGPKPLRTQYVKDFFDSLTGTDKQMMGTGGVDFLEKTKEAAPKFLNADQRAALSNFARTVQIASSEANPPMTSIMFRAGYMGLSLGSGLLAGKLSGNVAVGGLALATIPYAKSALTEMMMNPANVRLAAKLARLPQGAPEAQSIIKTLFRTGLRGARFELQTATGEALGLFEARSDGKLHPLETPAKTININPQIGWE